MRSNARSLTLALSLLIVGTWLAVTALGGRYFPRLSQVTSASPTRFLPAGAEATRVAELQMGSSGGARPPAIIVLHDEAGVSAEAKAAFDRRLLAIRDVEGVQQVLPFAPSRARTGSGEPLAYQAVVLLNGSMPAAVRGMRAELSGAHGRVEAFVAGPAGLITDMVSAFAGVDGPLLLVALAFVAVILVSVYRSPILPALVLFCAVAALTGAILVVFHLAAADLIVLEPQAQGILFILVVGATTDYALLLTARYREALRAQEAATAALMSAWRRTLEPVAASAGTVIAGLLCLLLSGLNSNKAVGPVAVAGIVSAVLASLTLLPALLALFGRVAFYPRAPRVLEGSGAPGRGGAWAAIGRQIARRPRMAWVATVTLLSVFAVFAPRFDASGTPQAKYVLGRSEARDGEALRAEYFGAGSGTPTVILTTPATAGEVARRAAGVPGVVSAGPSGGLAAELLGRIGVPSRRGTFQAEGREWASLDVTLAYAEDSAEALGVVAALRTAVREVDAGALVGGGSATALDTRTTARADLFRIVPIVLVVITLMLGVLLRSVLAPVLLVATTLLSYLATLGVAAVVFERLLRLPPADASVPLFGFVFLVALGIDYNIFLASRVREEALGRGTREGVLEGLRVTGEVITSAGVVLAATFAALAVIPVVFMLQIAFIVAFGVLVDTFIVRSLLVPGLLYDLGPATWWPWRLASDGPRGR